MPALNYAIVNRIVNMNKICVKKVKEQEEEAQLLRLDHATYKNITRKKEELYEQELSKLITENNRCQMILKKVKNPVHL